MPKQKTSVTMRVRVGDAELEVTGPSEFVKAEIAAFLKQAPGESQKEARDTATRPNAHPETKTKTRSPAQLFNECNPHTDNDRVLLAGYFLERFRQVESFTAAEARELIAQAKRPPPRNVNDAINQSIRKGLLMSAGDRENKMVFVVTSDGEKAVEDMMKTKPN